ncbi:DUF6600 domain-containing protein [Luteolibacter marinus]|uniref:DUF6600 domain-containing protein n=1 Tax=Luteolibacter marinus TaxID=2776705 RepID=UPI001867058B|nr:DUF6600 domain-containing protein [Luteolibacter marinus]
MILFRKLRILPVLCLALAACNKPPSSPGGAVRPPAADLEAERAAIEYERMAVERRRLDEARAALKEEKLALEAEREARLAAREEEIGFRDQSLEERQRELEEREATLDAREDDLAVWSEGLSEQELALAGTGPLDDWTPAPVEDFAEPVADYGVFYEDLQPYGSWFDTPDYGYVYQPTVVVQDNSWRPYTHGRWACSNLGWTWVSEEPFGWACFHYGRWTRLGRHGWVWVPGDQWAPSWVCWREGGDHVGWAPLPPESLCHRREGWGNRVEEELGIDPSWFNFAERRKMADPLGSHCLPVERNRDLLRGTRNVTKLRFLRDQVIAGGPRYESLRRAVGKPWPVYQIQMDRVHALRHPTLRNATVQGALLEVFAPNPAARWNGVLKPSRVQGVLDAGQGEPERGTQWSGRFQEERRERNEQGVLWSRQVGDLDVARKQLESNRERVAVAQRHSQARWHELARIREERSTRRQGAASPRASRPQADPVVALPRATTSSSAHEEPHLPARREATAGAAAAIPREETDAGGRSSQEFTGLRANAAAHPGSRNAGSIQAGRPERRAQVPATPGRVASVPRERDTRTTMPAEPTRAKPRDVRPEVTPEPAVVRNRQAEESGRRQQEIARQNAENLRLQRQQADEARRSAMAAREEATRRQQEESARLQREENARRQQQEEEGRRAREMARQQQEIARRQEEAKARLQQQMREQQEQRAREQEERRQRQAEERARQQEQQAREQAERAQRQEEARRQQEERARQQQEERARQQQEERARQQQEERARQQQEERARRLEESGRRKLGR